ncbi:MAG: permease [Alphaproteobacteria bacterium]|nr:permease [Alphaproteobacteria bacterium]
MTDITLTTRRTLGRLADRLDMPVAFLLAGITGLAVVAPGQAVESVVFTAEALVGVSIFLALSIAVAAYAKASGADQLIARAFSGRQTTMIMAAALVGALSPFCSCGVIPLIAALLAMGVPLAPVMAFWLASPLMDPSMFLLTAGTLGMEFALFKTAAAVMVGLLGGFGIYALMGVGAFANPLRDGIGNGGCGGVIVRNPKAIVWRFWQESARRVTFVGNAWENTRFLGKWLTIAFFLESLMLAYVPAETVSSLIGGDGWLPVLGATLVGVPAYLNGYAALPLVGGLIEQGMAPGAGMAFLLAGGVSSIPAAIAVWALARPPVFAAYLSFAFVGAFSMGALFGAIA